jgi:hypothetical protein
MSVGERRKAALPSPFDVIHAGSQGDSSFRWNDGFSASKPPRHADIELDVGRMAVEPAVGAYIEL